MDEFGVKCRWQWCGVDTSIITPEPTTTTTTTTMTTTTGGSKMWRSDRGCRRVRGMEKRKNREKEEEWNAGRLVGYRKEVWGVDRVIGWHSKEPSLGSTEVKSRHQTTQPPLPSFIPDETFYSILRTRFPEPCWPTPYSIPLAIYFYTVLLYLYSTGFTLTHSGSSFTLDNTSFVFSFLFFTFKVWNKNLKKMLK